MIDAFGIRTPGRYIVCSTAAATSLPISGSAGVPGKERSNWQRQRPSVVRHASAAVRFGRP